jgi:hypothetical protein
MHLPHAVKKLAIYLKIRLNWKRNFVYIDMPVAAKLGSGEAAILGKQNIFLIDTKATGDTCDSFLKRISI